MEKRGVALSFRGGGGYFLTHTVHVATPIAVGTRCLKKEKSM